MELTPPVALPSRGPVRNPVGPPGPVVLVPAALTDEALVADARAGLTPAQMVERKLASLLKSQPLPVSHLMTAKRTSRSR
jgi:hypothetical protein